MKNHFFAGAMLLGALHAVAQTPYPVAPPAPPDIVRVEYFFNADPGFGNGISLPVTAQQNINALATSLNISAASGGFTSVYLRSRDANGRWSHTEQFIFSRIDLSPYPGSSPSPANLVRAEYFINNDPGLGNAIPTALAAQPNASNQAVLVNLADLGPGFYQLGIRTLDANGHWSHTQIREFAKIGDSPAYPTAPTAASDVVAAEYFINTDPGLGLGKPLTIGSGANLQNINGIIDLTGLPQALQHTLGVRTRNAAGQWSLSQINFFTNIVPPPYPAAQPPATALQALEYFIDTDPGYGKGIPVAIPKTNILPGLQINANITGLAAGKHKIYFRTLDSLGRWSHNNVDSFVLAAQQPAPHIVVNSINGKAAYCAGDSLSIGYHATGTFDANNIFKAWLSDAAGSFATEQEIGMLQTNLSGLIGCRLPTHLPTGSGYKIRVKSSNPVVTGEPNGTTLTIRDRPFAQTITGRTQVNGGFSHPYNVGSVAGSTFHWLINGGTQSSGTNTNAITTAWTVSGSDSVNGNMRVIETNQFGCVGDTGLLAPITVYRLDIGDTTAISGCKGDALVVKAGITGSFDAGNILTAQLSNASGNFATATASATLAYTGSGVNRLATFNIPIPANLPNGNGYRVRIRSSLPVFIGDSTPNIAIQKPNLGADVTGAYCDGLSYNLTQHFNNNALAYTYYTQVFAPVPIPSSVLGGIYQVIGKNNFGCPDTAQVTVGILPKPNLGADTTVYHICVGETTNLLPLYNTGSLTAVWNTGNPSSVSPGIYQLIVTNTEGCKDTAFANIILPTAIWTGTVSTDWHTAGNWSSGKVPDSATHVIISTAIPRICIISTADALASSVQLNNGATLQQTNGKKLLLNGKCGVLPTQ